MTPEQSTPVKRSRRGWLVAGFVALGLAGAGTYAFWPRTDPPDPRPVVPAPLPPLTTSPFLNTAPGVMYVGDEACAGCHRSESRSYHAHPMGRGMFAAADSVHLEQYDAGVNNPFQAGPFHFQVSRKGTKLVHKEWCQDAKGRVVAQKEVEMAYAIGSGTHALSYLWQRDGFLFQSPITWYAKDSLDPASTSKWNLSPGYETVQAHFSRPIDTRCLYCHSQEAHHVPHTVNRYREPAFGQLTIGCERCHGPGELHVASRKKGPPEEDVDLTIVNPRHLSPVLREAVCQQCHLQGEHLVAQARPGTDGLPAGPAAPRVRLGLRVGARCRPPPQDCEPRPADAPEHCFKKSSGQFGCISCHDPHAKPAASDKFAYFRKHCLSCHDPHAEPSAKGAVKAATCSLAPAKRNKNADNCIACHMPSSPSSNVTHVALSDHRVVRHRDGPPKEKPALGRDDIPLVAFHRALLRPDDEELQRDLGVAIMTLPGGKSPVRHYLEKRALPILERAAARDPGDVPALAALGEAWLAHGQPDKALQALRNALAKIPERELTLIWAVRAASESGRLDLAEKYALRLVEAYSHTADHHHSLGVVYAKRKAWPEAVKAAQAALQADPFVAESRGLLIMGLLETGERDRAQAEFDSLGVLDPNYQERIWTQFAGQLRRVK